MTESEWLANREPAAMLRLIQGNDANHAEGLGGHLVGSDRKLRMWVEACRSNAHVRAKWPDLDKVEQPLSAFVDSWAGRSWDAEIPGATRANLLREIIGNPFRPVTLNPTWLTPAVLAIAKEIYEGRTFDELPVLADALEDAGALDDECEGCERLGSVLTPDNRWESCPRCDGTCREAGRLLAHLRSPGPHVRGCWALDLVLGRE